MRVFFGIFSFGILFPLSTLFACDIPPLDLSKLSQENVARRYVFVHQYPVLMHDDLSELKNRAEELAEKEIEVYENMETSTCEPTFSRNPDVINALTYRYKGRLFIDLTLAILLQEQLRSYGCVDGHPATLIVNLMTTVDHNQKGMKVVRSRSTFDLKLLNTESETSRSLIVERKKRSLQSPREGQRAFRKKRTDTARYVDYQRNLLSGRSQTQARLMDFLGISKSTIGLIPSRSKYNKAMIAEGICHSAPE